MKKDYTIFECDQCRKNEEIEKNSGFPYKKGWCYLYNFTVKFSDKEGVEKKDGHFCSKKCMQKYINILIGD